MLGENLWLNSKIMGFFPASFLLQIHNYVFDGIRVGNLAENKTLIFSGRLDENIAVIQHRRNDAGDFRGDILDADQFQFTDHPVEKPLLLDIHDSFVGNNPNIEIIIDPDEKKSYPDKHAEKIPQEIEKNVERRSDNGGKKNR